MAFYVRTSVVPVREFRYSYSYIFMINQFSWNININIFTPYIAFSSDEYGIVVLRGNNTLSNPSATRTRNICNQIDMFGTNKGI